MQCGRRNARRLAFFSLFLTVTLAVAGCAGSDAGGARDPEESPGKDVTMTPGHSDDAAGCGQLFPPQTDGVLTLDARFPDAAAGADGMVTGTVEATSSRPVRGVVSQQAEMFLVRDGRVVGLPMAQDLVGVQWDLAAGDVARLPGDATLISCEPGGGPVQPGEYQLYARVVVNPDDGPAVVSVGGPWPIRVS
jgi:hypothetical protein